MLRSRNRSIYLPIYLFGIGLNRSLHDLMDQSYLINRIAFKSLPFQKLRNLSFSFKVVKLTSRFSLKLLPFFVIDIYTNRYFANFLKKCLLKFNFSSI